MPSPRRIGTEAEDRAADFLLSAGYTLIARRRKLAGGELDLIAMDGDTVVFVEVKVRNTAYETAEASLNPRKERRIRFAAEAYLAEHGLGEHEVRFDLIALEGQEIRHEKEIFGA